MTGWQELALTAGVAATSWAVGRFVAPRIPPWRRMPAALMVLVVAVVLLVSLNYAMQWFPQSVFRLALMFGSFGWIMGVLGYRDPDPKGIGDEDPRRRDVNQEKE